MTAISSLLRNPPPRLPDAHWRAVARFLATRLRENELILAPPEFVHEFRGTIALHARRHMIPDAAIAYYVLHKGMLGWVDPALLGDALAGVPVFANEVFAVFTRRGEPRLSPAAESHLAPVYDYARTRTVTAEPQTTAAFVTTFNRPTHLAHLLRTLREEGVPVLVVDDGSSRGNAWRNRRHARWTGAAYVTTPHNLGKANALNIGIGHWLAHPLVAWISALDDDVSVARGAFSSLAEVASQTPDARRRAFTGYYDPSYRTGAATMIAGRTAFHLRHCAGLHLHAHRDFWQRLYPIPTSYARAPRSSGGYWPGQSSDTDLWFS